VEVNIKSVGYVAPHTAWPVGSTLSMWVFLPEESLGGTVFYKGMNLLVGEDKRNQPWAILAVQVGTRHGCVFAFTVW
jgi:hypothetical protein